MIRLAEHRQPPANDKGLSSGERIAFQQIGERLKKDSEAAPKAEAPEPVTPADEPEAPVAGSAETAHEPQAATPETVDVSDTEVISDDTAEPSGDDDRETEELQRLDGADDAALTDNDGGAPEAETSEDTAAAALDSIAREEAEGETQAPAPAETPAAKTEEPKGPEVAKPGRPGMSLLDFAQWDAAGDAASPEASEPADTGNEQPPAETGQDNDVAEAGASVPVDREASGWRKFTLVEMEEAASLDVWVPDVARSDAEEPAAMGDVPDIAAFTGEDAPSPDDDDQAMPASVDKALLAKTGTGLSILEKLPVPVLVHSGDTLHYANDEFAALTGYRSVEELAEAGGIGALFADSYEDEEAPGQCRSPVAAEDARRRGDPGRGVPAVGAVERRQGAASGSITGKAGRIGRHRPVAADCRTRGARRRDAHHHRYGDGWRSADFAGRHDPVDQPAGRSAVRLRKRRRRPASRLPRCLPSKASARRATISPACRRTASPACSMTVAR